MLARWGCTSTGAEGTGRDGTIDLRQSHFKTYYHGRVISRFRADEVAQQLLGDRMALFLEDF